MFPVYVRNEAKYLMFECVVFVIQILPHLCFLLISFDIHFIKKLNLYSIDYDMSANLC